jgi:type III secretion system (T3SS) SseB-like protein
LTSGDIRDRWPKTRIASRLGRGSTSPSYTKRVSDLFKRKRPVDEGLGPDTMLLIRGSEAVLDLPEGELVELEEELTLELMATPTKDGEKALLAFSSEEELREWFPEGGPYVEMRADDLLPLPFQHGYDLVMVSMSADCVFEFSRDDFMR